ncbi:hypothetical protein ACLB2K_045464 [Fragaria x ananassa]
MLRFHTLMVLSTALFGKPALQKLICNGLVLAEDGKIMIQLLAGLDNQFQTFEVFESVASGFEAAKEDVYGLCG